MKIHDVIHGLAIRAVHELSEIRGKLWEMEHVKSGAKLVWLDRKDENKTFSITFRTLPSDDTGVFHILEHSLLCGSQHYPVKEPFVELMKSSMHTFLNAMTFPDKTVYPVSSRNDKDFMNLLRVYMDAVLHPAIYSHPEIFFQEGWHYELDKDGSIVYKGVVLNEMKGVFASPNAIVQKEISRLLFPDTSYRYVSGGDPIHIPELTYEQFIEHHRRFYRPDNAYIILDGSVDLELVLNVLDTEYLSAYDRENTQLSIPMQRPIKSVPKKAYYELPPDEPVVGRARLIWGNVLGDFRNREAQMALRALADTLCGSNQSPLKRALLSAKLAQDVRISLMDGIQQPVAILEVRNMDESCIAAVENTVQSELKRLCHEGLDHEQLAAVLANYEFQMRERDYGSTPQGLGFSMDILDSWLYGGNPAANLEIGKLFTSLNRKLEEGWFERLLGQIFMDNPHNCQVLLLPSATLANEKRDAETERLRAVKKSWGVEDISGLQKRQAALIAWQSAADTPEALAALPALQLSDIAVQPERIPLEERTLAGRCLLRHDISTGRISYVNLYFDVSDFSQEMLPDVSFLCRLLGNMDTEIHGNLQLQRLCRLNIGRINFSVEAYGGVNAPENCRTFLCVSFSAMDINLESAANLIAEIITGSKFDDQCMIHELLRQAIVWMEQNISKHITWTYRKKFEEGKVSFQYKNFLGYRKGEDKQPEIVPEEAAIVERIYEMFLAGQPVKMIAQTLQAEKIEIPGKNLSFSKNMIMNILRNEKYCGDCILQKTVTVDCISKTRKANQGEAPMYIIENNHPAIISREVFNRAQEELIRRQALRAKSDKTSITATGKYSKYALTEVLQCAECGSRYRRVTWTAHGRKKIVWRCISRLDYGTKHCKDSITVEEAALHGAVVRALRRFHAEDESTVHIPDAHESHHWRSHRHKWRFGENRPADAPHRCAEQTDAGTGQRNRRRWKRRRKQRG